MFDASKEDVGALSDSARKFALNPKDEVKADRFRSLLETIQFSGSEAERLRGVDPKSLNGADSITFQKDLSELNPLEKLFINLKNQDVTSSLQTSQDKVTLAQDEATTIAEQRASIAGKFPEFQQALNSQVQHEDSVNLKSGIDKLIETLTLTSGEIRRGQDRFKAAPALRAIPNTVPANDPSSQGGINVGGINITIKDSNKTSKTLAKEIATDVAREITYRQATGKI